MNHNLLQLRRLEFSYLLLFYFLVFFLLLAEPVLSVDKLFGTCVPERCDIDGKGPDIRFPFWIPGKHPSHCGYPGFQLTCDNQQPVLKLIASEYIIRDINYEDQFFSVVDKRLMDDTHCPHPPFTLTFNHSVFHIVESNHNLLFFYNCTEEQELPHYQSIPCIPNNETHHSFARLNLTGSMMSSWNLPKKCEPYVSVPVMMDSKPQDNYLEILHKGFLLNWTAPNCSRCLESGGQCGYFENEYKCFCRDRPHLVSCKDQAYDRTECHPFSCGSVPPIQFPFSNTSTPECGLYQITCANNSIPMIKLEDHGRSYVVKSISYEAKQLVIQDDDLLRRRTHICNSLHSVTVPASPFLSFKVVTPNFTFFNCKRDQYPRLQHPFQLYNFTDCTDSALYYYPNDSLAALPNNCSVFEFPISESQVDPYRSKRDLLTLLAVGFGLGWELTRECEECYEKKGGTCSLNGTNRGFICLGERGNGKRRKFTIIGAVAGVGFSLCLVACIFLCYRKKCFCFSLTSSKLLSRAISLNPSLKSDLEKSNSLLGTQFFDYKELEEATNNFDPSKELGDGGFGIVYHGKLRDGRIVAVKRLYENNCRCVEQFKNEIKILSHLRHRNLVTFFGVVLIELISSKPAVDITRHRHEINLASMAISKIVNSALNELVDPTLGFESDHRVRTTITSVAGLAFRCLQDDKENRPSMEEVLESLRGIASEEYNVEKVEEVNTPADDEVLLKKMPPLSPVAVTDAWESRTTTPNTSG
ncbi:hypothetical protein MRB53_018541 [Persea americana]|uniref:Uncharacterized protein n=1 Tax=Persea americana TaxID=3435 RepID=A0ACC2M7S0_PERAE|nr:hypothetical protein MRB53_018541 [Persea americana]